MRILSLGAGVQSTTLALLAEKREIEPFDAAIFADTQSEPKAVYRHLDWLTKQVRFPIHRVTVGSLKHQILAAMRGEEAMHARPPFFTTGGGMLNRQCTEDFKIKPIQRKLRELLGIRPRQHGPKDVAVEQVIGISTDEASRQRDSRVRWSEHRYPLVENGLSRAACVDWLDDKGFPKPPKSACTFCPYHNDRMWREMKHDDPESFAEAVEVDEAIRPGMPGPRRPADTEWFAHRQRIPLRLVDFSTAEDRGQINMFADECAGVCGV